MWDGTIDGAAGRRRPTWSLAVLLLLPLLSETAAQEPPKPPSWPGKGDFVYIAATFKGLDASSGVPGARMHYDMPPCARLTVAKAKPAKQRWTIEDAMGGTIELLGPWTTRMHKGKTECEAQMNAEGEPALTNEGDRFTLAKKKAAQ